MLFTQNKLFFTHFTNLFNCIWFQNLISFFKYEMFSEWHRVWHWVIRNITIGHGRKMALPFYSSTFFNHMKIWNAVDFSMILVIPMGIG